MEEPVQKLSDRVMKWNCADDQMISSSLMRDRCIIRMLAAAANPCPCGYLGDAHHACGCAPAQVQRYRSRLSGPLLDRIDLQVEVPGLPAEELTSATPGEASAGVRERVLAARARQLARGGLNAHLDTHALEAACQLEDGERREQHCHGPSDYCEQRC